jgi:hypothetical protein
MLFTPVLAWIAGLVVVRTRLRLADLLGAW